MKESVVTICGKDLDKFEGKYKGYTVWFKLDSGFFKAKISTIHSELYKKTFEKDIEDQDTELYKKFIVPFDKKSFKTKNVKNGPKSITQSGARTSTRRNNGAQTSN